MRSLQPTNYDDTPVYQTQAVVQMTRVQAPRLRAWERRYAFLAPHRNTNKYRLYSARDVAIISWLRDQVEAGMNIAQAIAYLRHQQALGDEANVQGETVDIRLAEHAAHFVEAAHQLDETRVANLLSQALATYTIEEVCFQVITPALESIGACWVHDERSIIAEHFLFGMLRAQLETLFRATYHPPTGPLFLVGAVPGELHELGALMLALFMRRSGLRVSFLGQNMAATALVRMAQTLHPAAVCLSVTMPALVDATIHLTHELQAVHGLTIYLGGQAVDEIDENALPASAHCLGMQGLEAVTSIRKSTLLV